MRAHGAAKGACVQHMNNRCVLRVQGMWMNELPRANRLHKIVKTERGGQICKNVGTLPLCGGRERGRLLRGRFTPSDGGSCCACGHHRRCRR